MYTHKRAYAEGVAMPDSEASTDVTKPDSKPSQGDISPGRSWMVPIITVLLLATTSADGVEP